METVAPKRTENEFAASGHEPTSGDDLQRLRSLLLGAELGELLALKQQLENPHQFSVSVAKVISEALQIRARQDSSVAAALGTTIENALQRSIGNNRRAIAHVLYPVMGPAIRKSIRESFAQLFESFNQALEQSFSLKSLGWRIDAWRSGRSYSEVVLLKTRLYHVEQVFLIHRDTGLLLHHLMSHDAISKDPDMVSGMLTAIQDFISDSFSVSEDARLSTMQLGDLTVLVEQGPEAVIASVVRGHVTSEYRGVMTASLEECHHVYGYEFQHYSGVSTALIRLEELLQPCLKSVLSPGFEKKKNSNWFASIFLMLVAIGLVFWAYGSYRSARQWNAMVDLLSHEPGIEILEHSYGKVRGLKDPLARPLSLILDPSHIHGKGFEFQWQNFISAAPELILKRAEKALQPPASVTLLFHNGTLAISGRADTAWQQKLERRAPLLLGVEQLETGGLVVIDPDAVKLQGLLEAVNGLVIYYAIGQVHPTDEDLANIDTLAGQLHETLRLSSSKNKGLTVRITGYTDASGEPGLNQEIARNRAQIIRDLLLQRGVSPNIIAAEGNVNTEAGEGSREQDQSLRRIGINASLKEP